MTVIRLSNEHIAAIQAHGAEAFPYECVGVLLGEVEDNLKIVREARPLPNTFTPNEEFERSVGTDTQDVVLHGQERRFQIAPDAMFHLMREERKAGRKILGFYHSHPNHPARPSAYDREWASPWYSYLIISVMNSDPADLTSWLLQEDRNQFEPEEIQIGQD